MTPPDGRSSRRYERTSGRISVDYVVDGHPHSDYVISLSAGGVFVESKDPLSPGTRITLQFRLPDREEPFEVDASATSACKTTPQEPGVFHHDSHKSYSAAR